MGHEPTILCVDDDEIFLASIQRLLVDLDTACTLLTATSGQDALARLKTRRCDLVIVDLHMPGMSGMDLIGQIQRLGSDADVVVLTAIDDTQTVVQAMKSGACDYLTKPFEPHRLLTTLSNLLQKRALQDQNRQLRHELHSRRVRAFVGRSPGVQKVLQLVKQAGRVQSNVLILGESGTGKEVVARSIHHFGSHAEQPFVAVDCTAISAGLFESELFGHVRGAFTGAYESSAGLLRSARNGTVFLDEITEMPVTMQAKLLRAIQEREVRPVGSSHILPFNARVIAATNRDPRQLVSQGLLREDLYFRLAVIPIQIPPLRERPEDIPLLVDHFSAMYSPPGRPLHEVSEEAMRALMGYSWPGNVRELENCIERACALTSGSSIGVDDLPEHLQVGGQSWPGLDLAGRKESAERQAILEALDHCQGNRTEAARLLGMGRSTLYRKMKELGILAAGASPTGQSR